MSSSSLTIRDIRTQYRSQIQEFRKELSANQLESSRDGNALQRGVRFKDIRELYKDFRKQQKKEDSTGGTQNSSGGGGTSSSGSIPPSTTSSSSDLKTLAQKYVAQYETQGQHSLSEEERTALTNEVYNFYSQGSRAGRLEKIVA